MVGKDGRPQPKKQPGGGASNSTESRWLGRMVTNTLAELRARADTYDASGAVLEDKVAAEREEGARLRAAAWRRGEMHHVDVAQPNGRPFSLLATYTHTCACAVEKLQESRKRKRAEVAKLRKQITAARKRVRWVGVVGLIDVCV